MWYLNVSPPPSFYMGQHFTSTMEPLVLFHYYYFFFWGGVGGVGRCYSLRYWKKRGALGIVKYVRERNCIYFVVSFALAQFLFDCLRLDSLRQITNEFNLMVLTKLLVLESCRNLNWKTGQRCCVTQCFNEEICVTTRIYKRAERRSQREVCITAWKAWCELWRQNRHQVERRIL